MPWHQSRSNPRRVYDSYHREACIASTPELAEFIVRAANGATTAGATVPVRVREDNPDRPTAELPREPVNVVNKPPDTFETDECCTKHLARALRAGMTADEFLCPVCGCEWKPEMRGPIRHWIPVTMIALMKI